MMMSPAPSRRQLLALAAAGAGMLAAPRLPMAGSGTGAWQETIAGSARIRLGFSSHFNLENSCSSLYRNIFLSRSQQPIELVELPSWAAVRDRLACPGRQGGLDMGILPAGAEGADDPAAGDDLDEICRWPGETLVLLVTRRWQPWQGPARIACDHCRAGLTAGLLSVPVPRGQMAANLEAGILDGAITGRDHARMLCASPGLAKLGLHGVAAPPLRLALALVARAGRSGTPLPAFTIS